MKEGSRGKGSRGEEERRIGGKGKRRRKGERGKWGRGKGKRKMGEE